jgi:hypothetical protein
MKHIAKVGPMYLLRVSGIFKRSMPESVTIYNVNFGDCQLAVTALHAFVTVDGSTKSTEQLGKDDKIWVDISAFQADGSFHSNKSKNTDDHSIGCRCRSCE